jgi:transposase
MRTRYVRPLTEEERSALEALHREGHLHFERRRAHFILLSASGHHLKEAATLVGMSRKTAGNTLRAFEAQGVTGLHEPKRPGRNSRVSAQVLGQLDAALSQSPRLQGLPANNWTGPLVSRYLQEKHQISLSDDQARRLLHKLDYRQVRPRPRLAKGDPSGKEPRGAS